MKTEAFRGRVPVSLFLFGSGFCALVYQTVWLREFRMIFGASTAASAAVLGIFMGGLGLGSAWLGRRSELARRPLHYYGTLELWIAIGAGLTPLIFDLVRDAYIASGGSIGLGSGLSTVVRLALAALVLIVPTFLMGGTLPAIARAALTEEDLGRRKLALLYGWNTLGAVTGAAASTFYMLEFFGNRGTLWIACALNALVAMAAREFGARMPEVEPTVSSATEVEQSAVGSGRFVMLAAALVGFAFMLMELVWYRMLSPILGGSTFTFGLILMVALLGVGLGGAGYAMMRGNQRPSLNGFALSCALEALLIAVPYALGDRLAFLALMLRGLNSLGFLGQIFGWAIVTMIVVLPAAAVAGYQFPMLIALLGQGRSKVGRQTGLAYAANTAGAIVGSIIGGFVLLPRLTAPGAWRLVFVLLAILALGSACLGRRAKERFSLSALVLALFAAGLAWSEGPSAAWRHGGIGAGRARVASGADLNVIESYRSFVRRNLIWEAEGEESSVGIEGSFGLSFVVNGKVDGNSRGDAGTQIMSAMLGGVLHPQPKRALVVGLGTGSSAGWLAAIPGIERVDVVELEPTILEMARRSAAVNHDVLNNPKVRVLLGDAREVFQTATDTYDLIVSEPSNPYRAGIASLFTQDFYQATIKRLAPKGLFLQWIQSYDLDGAALQTVYSTLGSVFPYVETWRTQPGDLLLIGSFHEQQLEAAALRERIIGEPFRSALVQAWGVNSLEGMLSQYMANGEFCRLISGLNSPICTDDRNVLEFGFARGVGRSSNIEPADVYEIASQRGMHRPKIKGEVNWDLVIAQMPVCEALFSREMQNLSVPSEAFRIRRKLIGDYVGARYQSVQELVKGAKLEPLNPFEIEVFGVSCAALGDEGALKWADQMERINPGDAAAIRSQYFTTVRKWKEAEDALISAFKIWRTDPWVGRTIGSSAIIRSLQLAQESGDSDLRRRLFDALEQPFGVLCFNEHRLLTRFDLSRMAHNPPDWESVRRSIDAIGPALYWNATFLSVRETCFEALKDPRAKAAAEDRRRYFAGEANRLDYNLPRVKK